MKLPILVFIPNLVLFVSGKPPHLFGNGCIAANNQLFMVAFAQINTEKKKPSYYMDIPTITNSKEKIEIEWETDENSHRFPGKMVEFDGITNSSLYYVINGISPSDFMVNTFLNEYVHRPSISVDSAPTSAYNMESKVNLIPPSVRSENDLYLFDLFLPTDIRIAAKYNQKTYFLDDSSKVNPYGDPLNLITIQNQDDSKEVVETDGEFPVNKKGFSAAIHENHLFVTGGEFDGSDTNSIYVLDLITLKWSKFPVPNFRGARSGCLSYSDGYLIHAFGIREGAYLSSTQFVDTRTWSLVQAYDTPDGTSSNNTSSLIPIIVSVSCGVLLIVIIGLVFIYLKGRRGRGDADTILHPPEYITKSVWAEPRFSRFEMDTSLTTENSTLYFDSTSSQSGSLTKLMR